MPERFSQITLALTLVNRPPRLPRTIAHATKRGMSIDIVMEDTRWTEANLPTLATRAATATLTHLGHDPEGFEIVLLACDDPRIAALNEDFRAKPQATNVLSWPAADLAADTDGATPLPPQGAETSRGGPGEGVLETPLGDIAIAYDTCMREAVDQALPPADHVTHLIVHGTLHLLGYDHVRDQDATLMEGLETAILGKLGIRDPYKDDNGV